MKRTRPGYLALFQRKRINNKIDKLSKTKKLLLLTETESGIHVPDDIGYEIYKNSEITEVFLDSDELDGIDIACRSSIGKRYIKSLIIKAEDFDDIEGQTRICITQWSHQRMIGFAIVDLIQEGWYSKNLFVHLLCTVKSDKKLGYLMLKYIRENVCGECEIELESVSGAEGFYKKMGFKVKSEPHQGLTEFTLDSRFYKSRSRSKKSRSRSPRYSRSRSRKSKSR